MRIKRHLFQKLNLIFFIGSSKPKSIQMYLIWFELIAFLMFTLISFIIIMLVITYHQKQDIRTLTSQVVHLKEGLFKYELVYDDVLSKMYQPPQGDSSLFPESTEKTSAKSTIDVKEGSTEVPKVTPSATPPTIPQSKVVAPNAKENVQAPTDVDQVIKTPIEVAKKENAANEQDSTTPASATASLSIEKVKLKKVNNNFKLKFDFSNKLSGKVNQGYLIIKAQTDKSTNSTGNIFYPATFSQTDLDNKLFSKGYLFRIRSFKSFTVDLSSLNEGEQYTQVTFYIYSHVGDLVYEQNFPATY